MRIFWKFFAREISRDIVMVVAVAGIAVFAFAFSEPTLGPVGGTVYTPVNTGNVIQTKQATLIVSPGNFTASTGNLTAPNGQVWATAYCNGTGGSCSTPPFSGGSSQWTTSGSDIYYSTGKVGIGTGNPYQKLHIVGGASAPLYIETTPGNGADLLVKYGGSNEIVSIGSWTNGGIHFYSTCCGYTNPADGSIQLYPRSGNLIIKGTASKPGGGSWGNSSDERLKTNINPLMGALDKITSLKGVNFEWKNPEEHASRIGEIRAGFIAQDVEKVFPQFINEIDASGKDKELTADGKIKSLTLPFDFDAYLVEAVKEQQKEIELLKARIDALEKK